MKGHYKCKICEKEFDAYPKSRRIYCSQQCYHNLEHKKSHSIKMKLAWKDPITAARMSVGNPFKQKGHIPWNKGLTKNSNESMKILAKKVGIKNRERAETRPDLHPNVIMAKRGRISKGQRQLYNYLNLHLPQIEFKLEVPIKVKKYYKYADIGVPKYNIDIEYDGNYWHQDEMANIDRDMKILDTTKNWIIIRHKEKDSFRRTLKNVKHILGLFYHVNLPNNLEKAYANN